MKQATKCKTTNYSFIFRFIIRVEEKSVKGMKCWKLSYPKNVLTVTVSLVEYKLNKQLNYLIHIIMMLKTRLTFTFTHEVSRIINEYLFLF